MAKIPDWLSLGMLIFSTLGISGVIIYYLKNKFPSKQDQINIQKTKADFYKTYNDAKYVELQLNQQLEKMVEQETQKLRDILINRELENKENIDRLIDGYNKKIAEIFNELKLEKEKNEIATKKIIALEQRVKELEVKNDFKK